LTLMAISTTRYSRRSKGRFCHATMSSNTASVIGLMVSR
jgi:hypothetical protein